MRLTRGAAILSALVLAACTSGKVDQAPGSDPRQARLALELDGDKGALRGVIVGYPFLEPRQAPDLYVLAGFADGVPARSVVFRPDVPPGGPELIVRFNPEPESNPCASGERRARAAPPPAGADLVIQAAFCEGGRPLAVVQDVGPAVNGEDGRLVSRYRRLARNLFPDLYPERYGFDTGLGISIGVNTGY